MADVPPVRRHFLDLINGRNIDQEIQAAVANFKPLGFPVTAWTVSSINNLRMLSTRWLKSIKIVVSISDFDVLSRTLNLGVSRGFWIDHADCTPREFYEFCMWLRKPDGIKARDDIYFIIRIQKKKHKRALAASEEIREIGLKFEARIDELQIEIRKLRKDQEQEIKEYDDSTLNDCKQKKSECGMKNEAHIDELQIQISEMRKEKEEQIQKLQEQEEKLQKIPRMMN